MDFKNYHTNAPQDPTVGQVYFNPIIGKKYKWDGKEWKEVTK